MSAEEKNTSYKITPEDYGRILQGIDLVSIRMLTSSAELKEADFAGPLSINIKENSSYTTHKKSIVVFDEYILTARKKGQRASAVRISATFEVLIEGDGVSSFTDAFFEVFSKINLPVNTWPYFREFAQNMTQRMGIQPLTLPFFRV